MFMAMPGESQTKINIILTGLGGHAEDCALTSPRMDNAAIHALACLCFQGRLLQRKRRRQRQRTLPKERPAASSECCMARQRTIFAGIS